MVAAGRFLLMFLILLSAGPALAQEHRRYQLADQLILWVLADSRRDSNLGDVFPGREEIFSRYVPSGQAPAAILAFLLRSPEATILIDAGLGSGTLAKSLAEAGVVPGDISLVLLTHLHGDHLGGLMTDDRLTFPNARIRLAGEENDFWLDEASLAKFPDRRANFDLARKILPAYGAKVQPFEFGTEVAPGLTAVAALGHTPGHTAYLLSTGKEKILFWGDLIHAAALQFPRPDLSPRYDLDPEAAAATRLEFLDLVAREGWIVAGAHLPFPGLGRVTAVPGESPSFAFTPLE
ncbi:MAG: MBL fold metallo-hydrolase [Candidatus Adiutrix sp.]|jgi:glyoxylase-like metal-dependent hydrolase (beta-lactamase superfamily II)|nr:MBL fold metallo-hydrolase [Candidatus Adiutrix sp.]